MKIALLFSSCPFSLDCRAKVKNLEWSHVVFPSKVPVPGYFFVLSENLKIEISLLENVCNVKFSIGVKYHCSIPHLLLFHSER